MFGYSCFDSFSISIKKNYQQLNMFVLLINFKLITSKFNVYCNICSCFYLYKPFFNHIQFLSTNDFQNKSVE